APLAHTARAQGQGGETRRSKRGRFRHSARPGRQQVAAGIVRPAQNVDIGAARREGNLQLRPAITGAAPAAGVVELEQRVPCDGRRGKKREAASSRAAGADAYEALRYRERARNARPGGPYRACGRQTDEIVVRVRARSGVRLRLELEPAGY